MLKNTLKRIGNYTCLWIAVAAFPACTQQHSEDQSSDITIQGDTISVNEESAVFGKIKTKEIKEKNHQREIRTTGTVKAIPNLYAEIAPPVSGRVTQVYLQLGMNTKPGTPLFEMVSPEFLEAQKVYFQAKEELHTAALTLKRQKDLNAHGVGAARDLEEASAAHAVSEKEYQNTRAALKVFGVNADRMVFGQPMVVTSPIAGKVITNEVVNGHYIKADDPAHAVVAELSRVWVVGMVKEKDIRFLHKADEAAIVLTAFPGKVINGRISHVDEIVDEETRSVQVRVECDNNDQLLKPGMYATVRFTDSPQKAIFVPEKAVLQYNDQSYVFIEAAKGRYVPRYIETGITKNGEIQIVSGLTPNETIISEGAFYLLKAK